MTAPTQQGSHLFEDFFRNVDEVLASVGSAASSGMAEYVMSVAWVSLAVLMLVWALAIWHGNGSSVKDWFTKMAKFVFILQIATVFYGTWVTAPLMSIPNELTLAVSKGQALAAGADQIMTSTSAADQFVGSFEQLIMGTMQAAVEAFKQWNVGGAIALISASVLMIIAGVLLIVAIIFNMLYAKIGLFYILAIGPLFIFFLAIPGIKNWFYGWLNTAFYFVMLSVLSTLSMILFTGIANKFMSKLTIAYQQAFDSQLGLAESVYSMLVKAIGGKGVEGAAGAGDALTGAAAAQMNVLSISLQMILIFIPMFLVALETRTLASSLTGGSGGSFGQGLVGVVSTMWRGGIGRGGGQKKADPGMKQTDSKNDNGSGS